MDFVDERERELYAAAMLGEDTRKFLRTDPIGQYVLHRANTMLKLCEQEALKVDPDGWRGWWKARLQLRRIRAKADAARMVLRWFSEAIEDGDNAARELDEYRKPQ